MVTNQRQTSLLSKAKSELQDVIQAVDNGIPVDIAQIDFTGAWDTLGEITGESAPVMLDVKQLLPVLIWVKRRF